MEKSNGRDRRIYCFGEYRFVPERQLLQRGGQPVRVGTRALELLHALVKRPGDLISKDELIQSAWPTTFVHEGNLKVNIAALRRALPCSSAELPYIATVPGRGYRFVAPLRILGGSDDFAVPDSREPGSGTLPRLPKIIGRAAIVAELSDLLEKTRLLTVAGPAGVGKTTVAVALAGSVAHRFKDAVVFVDLAAVCDPQRVAAAIAIALGVESNLTDLLPRIIETLRDRDALLLLDNCEHVLSAAANIAEHLTLALPALHIIATSREPLRSRSETVYRLAPLQCPSEENIDAVTAMTFPAIELLVIRAGAHGYQIKDEDGPALAAICRRLDGIALAIELAASRLGAGSPAILLRLLEHSFAPLAAEEEAVPLRHRTLIATLDWSYRLLSSDEARLLRHLSVFGGAFTLDDVAGLTRHFEIAVEAVASWLESLAAKSLLAVTYRIGGLHYRLLDSTRSFAAERLRASGEQDTAMASYARHLLALFETADAEWHWRDRGDWTARYGPWANDLRRAIDWALEDANAPELGVRLTAAATSLWNEFSSVVENRMRVATALHNAERLPAADSALKVKLMLAHASNLLFSGSLGPDTDTAWTESLHAADALGSAEYQIRAQWGIASMRNFSGWHREALSYIERFSEVIERKSDRSAIPDAMRLRLTTIFYLGDIAGARAGLETLVREHAAVAGRARISRFQLDRFGAIRLSLAYVTWIAGDHARALELAGEGLSRTVALDHHISNMHALALTSIPLALMRGALDEAEQHLAALMQKIALTQIDTWRPFSRFYRSALDSAQGDPEGVDGMRAAIDALIASNYQMRLPFRLAMLAADALRHDRIEIARTSIHEAFESANRQEENWCRGELLRVRGLIEWRDGDMAAAEETLLQAMRTAETSGALTFQLRAATDLARLWRQANRNADAVALLARICDRFDRNPVSADVVAARDLLQSLTPNRRSEFQHSPADNISRP